MEHEQTPNFVYLFATDQMSAEKSLMGGILVVDKDGNPLEIQCTDSIKLTTIERIAYGTNLKRRMLITQFALPLLNALKHQAHICFINDITFFSLQKHINMLVCLIRKKDEGGYHLRFLKNQEANEGEVTAMLNRSTLSSDPLEPFQRLQVALEYVDEKGWENVN